MKIPLIIVTYLPKKWQDKYIQSVWDSKSDSSIIESFTDATKWVDLSLGMFESPTLIKVAEDCLVRLEVFILPQMRKRGLLDIPNRETA